MSENTSIKITMEIPKKIAESVKCLSSLVGRNKATVVVEAIQIYKLMWETKIDGGRVIVENKNGTMKEIVMKCNE